MSKPQKIPLKKLEDLCVQGAITEDMFIKQIKSRYTEDDAGMIIAGVQKRLKEKDQPKEEVEELKTTFVRSLSLGNLVLETIMWRKKPLFLVFNRTTQDLKKRWTTSPEFEYGPVKYLPMSDTPYKPYGVNDDDMNWLQNELREVQPLHLFYPKIYQEVKTFVDATEEILSLITNSTILSYEQHKYNSLGYPSFLGVPDSGKTRVGEVINEIGYRPLMSMKLNAPNVYDFIGTENEGDCIIIDDEIQDLNDDPEKAKIYRSGYRKGGRVRRILEPSSTKRTHRYYNTYCLKIFLGYYLPNDAALVSRCIPQIMVSGEPEKDEIEDEDRVRFTRLKNKLLLSRMVHYHEPLPKITVKLKGRNKEVWKAQLLCSYNTAAKDSIVTLVDQYIKEQEIERRESIDSYLVTVVSVLLEFGDGFPITFSDIWSNLLIYLDEGDSLTNGLSKVFIRKLDRNISKWTIGKKLKTVLVGRKVTSWLGDKTRVAYHFNKGVLKTLEKRLCILPEDKYECTKICYQGDATRAKAKEMWIK